MFELFTTILPTILLFSAVFSFLVVVHELGHYCTARWFKVGTSEFAVGFGNLVYSIQDKNHTQWSLRALPFGGYVAILDQETLDQETLNDQKQTNSKTDSATKSDSKTNSTTKSNIKINGKPIEKATYMEKVIIFIGGPLFNFIAAFILATFAIFFYGWQPTPNNIVESSQVTHIQPKDKILLIDAMSVTNWKEVQINLQGKEKALLSIERQTDSGSVNTILIEAKANAIQEPKTLNLIQKGLAFVFNIFGYQMKEHKTTYKWDIKPNQTIKQDMSFFGSIKQSLLFVMSSMIEFLFMLKLIAYSGIGLLSGPIGIAKSLSTAASVGFETLLWITIKLSMSLGLFNLLPLPMLDGGQVLLASISKIRGKPLSHFFLHLWGYMGLVLIGGLMLFITLQDLLK